MSDGARADGRGGEDGGAGGDRERVVASPADGGGPGDPPREPCLRCGVRLPLRQMGCKGGHCPNCGHPYPHGDCSD